MAGRKFLEELNRHRRLLEMLQRTEERLKRERERAYRREVEWACKELALALEEAGVWRDERFLSAWRKRIEGREELWQELGLAFLLPEGEEARKELTVRNEGNGKQEEEVPETGAGAELVGEAPEGEEGLNLSGAVSF